MSALESKAVSELNIIAASLKRDLSKQGTVRQTSSNSMKKNLEMNKIQEAYEAFTRLVSAFRQEKVLVQMDQAVQMVRGNIHDIINSKVVPEQLKAEIALLVFASRSSYSLDVVRFERDILRKLYDQKVLDSLYKSPLVPTEVINAHAQTEFTLDQLHAYADEIQRVTKVNLDWFRKAYPLGDSSTNNEIHHVMTFGRPVYNRASASGSASYMKAEQKETLEERSTFETQPFSVRDFMDMEDNVKITIARWNDFGVWNE